MESLDPFDDGKNRCDLCGTELPWQVHDLCEICRDRFFGSLEENQAIADYYEHRASHSDCDCL